VAVSPSVLSQAVRATQAGGYTLAVSGYVDVQGQGFPIRSGGRGGHVEIDVGSTRRTVDLQPARLLTALRGVESVRRLGPAVVDGVRTTHYYAEVRTPTAQVRQFGDSIPVDVWLDPSGRIRRVRAQLAAANFTAVPQIDVR
jgi:hypothetical protein